MSTSFSIGFERLLKKAEQETPTSVTGGSPLVKEPSGNASSGTSTLAGKLLSGPSQAPKTTIAPIAKTTIPKAPVNINSMRNVTPTDTSQVLKTVTNGESSSLVPYDIAPAEGAMPLAKQTAGTLSKGVTAAGSKIPTLAMGAMKGMGVGLAADVGGSYLNDALGIDAHPGADTGYWNSVTHRMGNVGSKTVAGAGAGTIVPGVGTAAGGLIGATGGVADIVYDAAKEGYGAASAAHDNNSIFHHDVTSYDAPKSTKNWDTSKLDPSKMGYNENKPIYNMDNASGIGESGKVNPAVLSQHYNRQNELAADEQIARGAPGIDHDSAEIVKQQADREAGGAFGSGSKGIWGRAGDFVGHVIPGAETAGKWADSVQSNIPLANRVLGAGSHFQMPFVDGHGWSPIGNYLGDAGDKLKPLQNIADNGSIFEKGQAAWDMGPQVAFGNTADKMVGLSSQEGQKNLTDTSQKITSQGDKYGDNAKMIAGGAGLLGIAGLLGGSGGQQGNTTINNYNGVGLPNDMRDKKDPYAVKNFNMI